MQSIIQNADSFIEFTSTELMTNKVKITLDIPFRDLENWNSLNALIYISRIHEVTGVMISSTDLAKLISFGDIYTLIQTRIIKEN
jgi:acyl carrier protein